MPTSRNSTGIAVLARAPVPGAAKTRLIPRLGPGGAARLHAALVRKALATACAAALGPVTLWCTPNVEHAFFTACARDFGVTLASQPTGDLGARMLEPFIAAAPLLLIGTDSPVMTPADLQACAQALDAGKDAVFLPAEDGGYGLVGLRKPQPALFEGVDWGTDRVMAQTRDILAREGLTHAEPRIIFDIDRPEDVDRLISSGLLPDWTVSG